MCSCLLIDGGPPPVGAWAVATAAAVGRNRGLPAGTRRGTAGGAYLRLVGRWLDGGGWCTATSGGWPILQPPHL